VERNDFCLVFIMERFGLGTSPHAGFAWHGKIHARRRTEKAESHPATPRPVKGNTNSVIKIEMSRLSASGDERGSGIAHFIDSPIFCTGSRLKFLFAVGA